MESFQRQAVLELKMWHDFVFQLIISIFQLMLPISQHMHTHPPFLDADKVVVFIGSSELTLKMFITTS